MIRLTSVRTVLSAYIGGLALERLYLKEGVCYRLVVARKEGEGHGSLESRVNGDGDHA
jgi:hypothetical protein